MFDRARLSVVALALGLLTSPSASWPVRLRPMKTKNTAPGSKPSRPCPPARRPAVTPTSTSISPSAPGSTLRSRARVTATRSRRSSSTCREASSPTPTPPRSATRSNSGWTNAQPTLRWGSSNPLSSSIPATIQTGYTPALQPRTAARTGGAAGLQNVPLQLPDLPGHLRPDRRRLRPAFSHHRDHPDVRACRIQTVDVGGAGIPGQRRPALQARRILPVRQPDPIQRAGKAVLLELRRPAPGRSNRK